MQITAAQVNELRTMTGSGLMDCKKALTESNGDIQAAFDYLRKKGAKIAELRAGRETTEGCIVAVTTADAKLGVIAYVSCETDFVSKNEEFRAFATSVANAALAAGASTKEEVLALTLDGTKIADKLQEKVSAIGELIQLSAYEKLTGETVVAYNHAGNKIGVLVAMNNPKSDVNVEAGKDVAMQVAAMNPLAVDASGVAQEVVDREVAIAKEKAVAAGKPANILDKIAEGAANTFLKENTLLTQPFVKDGSKNVTQFLAEAEKGLTVTAFKRIALGVK
ncbi:MAG: elongation factor Ts [Chitinophagales bacterium]|nr:elongation factor Ts [Chitinophagales bacterium]